jgi:hypothetical protein
MAPYRGKILTGARARLSINGVKLALCMNVSYGEEIQHDPVEPLDQYEVAEHVPVAYRVQFSAQMVRIITNSIKNRDGVVIFPTLENILSHGEMTATVEDPTTGTVLANIQRVKATGYRANIGARGIALEDCEFVAIRIRNESELA